MRQRWKVTNPTTAVASVSNGGGHGLIGMRERVEGCGGRLAVGARAQGTFGVRAWLPSR
jgi:signal transduction histidine kinase